MQYRWIIWLIATVFIAYGLLFTFLPLQMAEWVTGDYPDSVSGVIDLRATYGGMSIAVGAILLVLGRKDATVPIALLAAALVLGMMALTRTVGIFIDGGANTIMYAFLVAEIIGATLVLWMRQKVSGRVDSVR